MYAGTMTTGKQCAYLGAVLGFSVGGVMLVMGIVWFAVATGQQDVFTTMGGIFLAIGLIMLPCAVGLCWYTCKKVPEENYPQGPIVSGSAPPGPVTGFGAHQQGYPQAGAFPSAPLIGDDTAAPPRYDDLVQ